ncbi:hypothetical protein TRIUR3_10588 [Triticum urartu]|uniref:Uncharacterized protein n=1 Tax=Triticum urartu TaxID=4572 RepID=M8A0E5_TRIUA|nr:hypothetical protein TRIUR3_10588 [Triticum urartu]
MSSIHQTILVQGLGLLLEVILHIELVEDEEEHLAPLPVVVGFETELEWDVRSIADMMHGRSRDKGTWVRKQRRWGVRALEVRCNSRMMLAWKNGNKVKIRKPKRNIVKWKLKWENVFRWSIHGNGSVSMKLSVFTMAAWGGVKTTVASPSERLRQWVRGALMRNVRRI